MKKIILSLVTFFTILNLSAASREITGSDAQKLIPGAEKIRVSEFSKVPEFVSFKSGSEIPFDNFQKWAHSTLRIPASHGFLLLNKENDKMGMTHYRYRQTINGIPVEGTMYIVHTRNGMIESVGGQIFDNIASSAASIEKPVALQSALQNMNASVYRWQVSSWEEHIKSVQNNVNATWYPQGELTYAPVDGKYKPENYRLCYKFDVYAQEPLKREYIFVDAANGNVIYKINRIQHGDVPAQAVTGYSGTRTMTTDSVNANTYTLRNAGRGLGVETYDLQQGTTYLNTDFTDSDNFWDNANAQLDQYATDAHWGAQVSYDFYFLNYNRNSLDDAGQKLLSYVHYDFNFVNAFWDGTAMTYGDGGNGYTPLTSLDITGHEISHGITENTCGLIYADESGGLNEGFSDCMGNAIRQYGKQSATIDWGIGNEIGGTPFRNMANPNQYNNPDCYNGLYWNAPNEVHNNSGVLNFWFYLLTEGGTGTNDLNNIYAVSPLGIDTAAAILYRTWAVYLFPNATYADARYYSIQAASDLYGACTNAVIQTTNAWHAVGVGNAFVFGVSSGFTAPLTVFCQVPADVYFTNTSNNGGTYYWDFGDGTTSTATSPVHTYNAFGTYDVKLIADGGSCGIDSILKIAYVDIDDLNPCIVVLNNGTNQVQTACAGQIFDTGGPSANYADNTNSSITISPVGASTVTLDFTLFEMETNWDYLTVYDGPTTASPQIGSYTGFTLPNGGSITSTGSSITLVQTSDVSVTEAGFAFTWQCLISNVAPSANFTANITTSCTGDIIFTDLSTNAPTNWLWDFGDATTSTLQSPSHTYTASGTYTVTLTASNSFGLDTYTEVSYITISLPVAPQATNVDICPGNTADLIAAGTDSLVWFTQPVGGLPVFTGSTYTTPVLNTTTTYYVESDIYPSAQFGGPQDNTIGGGSYFVNTNYHNLIFDCSAPVKLVSVLVYAQGAGTRIITLMDNFGTVLNSVSVNIPDGTSRVTLNFDLPVGTNLELGCEGNVNLYRNNSGALFPFNIGGVVSITGTNAGAAGYYYYFYDWELQGAPCVSARTAVTANVANIVADFSYVVSAVTYTFTDLSTGAITWTWDFDDGTSSSLQNPVHTYTANGTYTVTLVVSDGTCSSTITQTVIITSVGIDDLTESGAIFTYPNPVTSQLVINFGNLKNSSSVIRINNSLGQLVSETKVTAPGTTHTLDVTSLAPGIYELSVTGDEKSFVQKIVKQ